MPQRQCLRAISRRDEVAAFDFRIAMLLRHPKRRAGVFGQSVDWA
jgi:hypothetical protein